MTDTFTCALCGKTLPMEEHAPFGQMGGMIDGNLHTLTYDQCMTCYSSGFNRKDMLIAMWDKHVERVRRRLTTPD